MVFLVLSSVEESVTWETWDSSEFLALHEEITDIEREYGLTEDDVWRKGEGPPEWQALNDEWVRRFNALRLQWLRELGFRDIANLWESDPDALDRRYQKGHDEICGPPIEEEIEALIEAHRRELEQGRQEHPLKLWRLGPTTD